MRVPLMLDLTGHPVVCVGAGPVAANKVGPLVDAGAVVTLIAPDIGEGWGGAQSVRQRLYRAGDLEADPPVRLVVAATGIQTVDQQVATDAARLGIWCLRVDGTGDVSVPAVLRQGGLTLALSTGAPALTRRLRERLADVIDPRWGTASTTLSTLRADPEVRAVLSQIQPAERRARWHRAVDALLDNGELGPDSVLAILTGGDMHR